MGDPAMYEWISVEDMVAMTNSHVRELEARLQRVSEHNQNMAAHIEKQATFWSRQRDLSVNRFGRLPRTPERASC